MKRIEDIEKMGLEELEAAAMEEKVDLSSFRLQCGGKLPAISG